LGTQRQLGRESVHGAMDINSYNIYTFPTTRRTARISHRKSCTHTCTIYISVTRDGGSAGCRSTAVCFVTPAPGLRVVRSPALYKLASGREVKQLVHCMLGAAGRATSRPCRRRCRGSGSLGRSCRRTGRGQGRGPRPTKLREGALCSCVLRVGGLPSFTWPTPPHPL